MSEADKHTWGCVVLGLEEALRLLKENGPATAQRRIAYFIAHLNAKIAEEPK